MLPQTPTPSVSTHLKELRQEKTYLLAKLKGSLSEEDMLTIMDVLREKNAKIRELEKQDGKKN